MPSFTSKLIDAWRNDAACAAQRAIERVYVEVLERLERDGITCAPILRRALERESAEGSERAAA